MAISPYLISNKFRSLNAAATNRAVPARYSDSFRNIQEAVNGALATSNYPLSNPAFDYGAAGRVVSSLRHDSAKIIRGHIRRSVVENADPTSKYRLYFMYNPDVIERTYVSYLEQAALDPFNTVFGSNNLVAPPGVLDFSFEMFFDRQTENANGTMPRGVLEDFDYFDLVVRGVIPGAGTGDLPDNGVLMVNPRNITVVFSPQLTVQGRPHSAEVIYQKFDHRMNPVRMTIRVTMKAHYVGVMRRDFQFAQTQQVGIHQSTVPYDETITYTASSEVVTPKVYKTPPIVASAGSPYENSFSNPGVPGGGTSWGGGPYTGVTGLLAERIVAIAAGEVGTLEEAGNYQKYGEAYGWNGQFWCAQFVWWVYRQAGIEPIKTASVPELEKWAYRQGYVIPLEQVLPGDIVTMDWSPESKWLGDSDHVEIAIERYNGSGSLRCIGGNTSGTYEGSQTNGDGVFYKVRSVENISFVIQIPEIHRGSSGIVMPV